MKILGSYEGVLLDIDDTLYNYEHGHALAIAAVYDEIAVFAQHFSRDEFLAEYRENRTRVNKAHGGSGACRSRFLAFQGMLEACNVPAAYGPAFEAEELYWDHLIANMKPNYELISLLRNFAENGGRICAVTDMQARVQVQKLKALGVDDIVTLMVTSEEVGVEKPDPRIFSCALNKLGLAPFAVIMIGDSLEKDIQGATLIGMDTWQISIEQ